VFGKCIEFSTLVRITHDEDDSAGALSTARTTTKQAKIWIWGLSQQGMIWEKLQVLIPDGQYAEVQSGIV